MKGLKFSDKLKEAGKALAMIASSEPSVVVRKGLDGQEFPVKAVKCRRGVIILEF